MPTQIPRTKPEPSDADRTRKIAANVVGMLMLYTAVAGFTGAYWALLALPDEGFVLTSYLVVAWIAAIALMAMVWRYDKLTAWIAGLILERTRRRARTRSSSAGQRRIY